MEEFLKRYFDKIILKILFLTVISSTGIGLMLFYFHTSAQKEMLSTEITNRSVASGNSIAYIITKAIQVGIPFDEMVKVNEFISENEKKLTDVDYIAITDIKGKTLYKSDSLPNSLKGSFKRFALTTEPDDELKAYDVQNYYNIPIKIVYKKQIYGYLHLGISKKITTNRIMDIYYDILTILFVSMIAGAEFFLFIFRNRIQLTMMDLFSTMRKITNGNFSTLTCIRTLNSISAVTEKFNIIISSIASEYAALKSKIDKIFEKSSNTGQYIMIKEQLTKFTKKYYLPQDEKPHQEVLQPTVQNMRLPAFLMVLAETVLVAILPGYTSQFYDPAMGLTKEFISGSPILVFMIASTLGVLMSSKLSYNFGFRKSIMIGISISALGYIVSFSTSGLILMLIARAITAFGYGISYACLQNYIAAYAPTGRKIECYAVFAIAFGAAYICGAPIGGILVDNIGFKFTFAVAAFASIASLLITSNFLIDFHDKTLRQAREPKKKPMELLKNKSFMVTLISGAMPARLMFSSLICLFYPLYLRNLGFSQSSTGRNLMIFGVVTFAFSGLAAKAIEKLKKYSTFILFMSIFLISVSISIPIFFKSDFAPSIALLLYSISAVIHTCIILSILEDFSIKEYENYRKSTVLAYYFTTERIGMTMGPALISTLLHALSFTKTMLVLAIFMFIFSMIYGIFHFFNRKFPKITKNLRYEEQS